MPLRDTLTKLIAMLEYYGLPVRGFRDWYQARLTPIGLYSDLNQKWLRDLDIRTVADIGANTGQFAKAIHRVFPAASIYSFEPLKDCYERLLALKAEISSLEAFNCAVGDRNDRVAINRNDFSPSSSLLPMTSLHKEAFPQTSGETKSDAQMVRLDDFVDRFEANGNLLVKIDVQGYEDKVIEGGRKVLSAARCLIVEMSYRPLYEGEASFDALYRSVTSLGFRYAGNLNALRNPADGSVLQTDSVFLRDPSP